MDRKKHIISPELNGACLIAAADGSKTWGNCQDGHRVGLWRTNMNDALSSVEYYEQDGTLNKKLTSSLNRTITMNAFQTSVAQMFKQESWMPKQSTESAIQKKVDSYQQK